MSGKGHSRTYREQLLLPFGSQNAGRHENRVHPLDDFLLGLALRLFAELEVALYESQASVGQYV